MSTKKDSNLNTQKKIGLSEKELPAGRSCFRMTFLIYGFQFLIDNVGIQLCGGDVTMSHQLLQGSKICTVFQQVHRKTVAQCMGRDLFFNAGFGLLVLEDFPETLTAHSGTAHIDK